MATRSRSTAGHMVEQLLTGTSSTPADLSSKHILKLMNKYVKCVEESGTEDVQLQLLQQICVANKMQLDCRSSLNVKNIESAATSQILKSDEMQVCREFLKCVLTKAIPSRKRDEDHLALLFLARVSFYKLLVIMTDMLDTEVIKAVLDNKILDWVTYDFDECYQHWHLQFKSFRHAGADKLNSIGPVIGLSLLENCSTVQRLPQETYTNLICVLYEYADADKNAIVLVILAISLIRKINLFDEIYKKLYTKKVFMNIARYLKGSVHDAMYNKFRFPMEEAVNPVFGMTQRINLSSLLNCLLTLVNSDDYKCNTIQTLRTYISKLDEILKEGNTDEKDQLSFLFKELCQHSCSKCSWSYLGDLLLKHGILPHDPKAGGASGRGMIKDAVPKCHYMESCKYYLQQLDKDHNILDQFMDQEYHRCFCEACMRARGDKSSYERGVPSKKYALPLGWTKFALKVPPRAVPWGMFDRWHVAFHGSNKDEMFGIFTEGDLEMRGAGDNNICVTPSIRYATRSSNVPWHRLGNISGRVAFQVRIQPESYDVLPAATDYTHSDPEFPDKELIWKPKNQNRPLVIIVGILVAVRSEDPGKK